MISDGYVTVRRDKSLHIERIRLRDGGKYICLASNVAGTSNRTTTVTIFGECYSTDSAGDIT